MCLLSASVAETLQVIIMSSDLKLTYPELEEELEETDDALDRLELDDEWRLKGKKNHLYFLFSILSSLRDQMDYDSLTFLILSLQLYLEVFLY